MNSSRTSKNQNNTKVGRNIFYAAKNCNIYVHKRFYQPGLDSEDEKVYAFGSDELKRDLAPLKYEEIMQEFRIFEEAINNHLFDEQCVIFIDISSSLHSTSSMLLKKPLADARYTPVVYYMDSKTNTRRTKKVHLYVYPEDTGRVNRHVYTTHVMWNSSELEPSNRTPQQQSNPLPHVQSNSPYPGYEQSTDQHHEHSIPLYPEGHSAQRNYGHSVLPYQGQYVPQAPYGQPMMPYYPGSSVPPSQGHLIPQASYGQPEAPYYQRSSVPQAPYGQPMEPHYQGSPFPYPQGQYAPQVPYGHATVPYYQGQSNPQASHGESSAPHVPCATTSAQGQWNPQWNPQWSPQWSPSVHGQSNVQPNLPDQGMSKSSHERH